MQRDEGFSIILKILIIRNDKWADKNSRARSRESECKKVAKTGGSGKNGICRKANEKVTNKWQEGNVVPYVVERCYFA